MNKIKKYRVLKDVTQEEVANVLNIRQHTYSLKEQGKAKFTLEEAIILAKYYDMTVEELFC